MSKYRAEVRIHGGVPTAFVNGAPIHGLMIMHEGLPFMLSVRPGMYLIHQPPVMDEDGGISPPLRERIDRVLQKEPHALLALYTFPWALPRWAAAHPGELQAFDVDVARYGVLPPVLPSFASRSWQESFVRYYETFAARLHQEYEGRFVLHNFGAGSCGEWNPFGAPDFSGRWFAEDFSPAMHAHFRAWLRQRYADDEAALRRAWSDPAATFATAAVPNREERLATDWFAFRSPRKRKVADYCAAYADAIADCIVAFGSAIKRATNREVIVSSHCGGFLDNGFCAYLYNQTVINCLHRVVRSDAVDCLAGPVSYIGRRPGGSPSPMMPTGTLRLHGKCRLQDQDTRTHLSAAAIIPGNDAFNFLGVPANLPESLAVMQRDTGRVLLGGHLHWWHDLSRRNFGDPAVQECAARLTELGRVALHLERGFLPDMAVLADEQAVFHQQCANRLLYPLLYGQRVEAFSHAGVSWEIFEMEDFFEPQFPASRLCLLLNPFTLDQARIRAVRAKLAGSGRTVVWFVAPGLQQPDGFDLGAIESLTGFHISAVNAEANPRVSLIDYEHPVTRGLGSLRQPHSFGTGLLGNDEREGILGPILWIDDPQAQVLGLLDSLHRPGFAVKQMDGWTSVYSCAPRLSRGLLRNLASFAGLHSYLDTEDMLAVAPELLLLHGGGAGERVVHFPAARDVVDLWTGEVLGSGVRDCTVTLAACDTRLLFHGELARLTAARQQAAQTSSPF